MTKSLRGRRSGLAGMRWRGVLLPLFVAAGTVSAVPAATQEDQAAAIVSIVREAMAENDLKAVIVKVVVDGKEIVTSALGESMTGVPATPDMHFRNGNVAFAYITTLLLQLVDEKRISLDDKLAKWLPDLPHSDRITLRMLASMTSGYADYVRDEQFAPTLYADPFRQFTPQELINIGVSKPLHFEPGTNWSYSHTGYVILGQVLEKITGKPLAALMQEKIFGPLGLRDTDAPATAEIRAPVLHAFTSERRAELGVAPSVRFYEESTYWSPSWTTAPGAVQTTNIHDMTASAVAVGSGSLLSPESHRAQVGSDLVGFGSKTPECPMCRTLDRTQGYGMGVFLQGSWILQSPLFYGYAATAGYLPSKGIAIAVATTFGEKSFDEQGSYKNSKAGASILAKIGAYLAPDDPP